jgi:transposase
MSQRNHSSAPASSPQPQSPPELKAGEYAALVGVDWGDRTHSVAIALPGKETEEVSTFEHSAESLHQWLDSLEMRFQRQRVAFAVEAGSKPVTRALRGRSWAVIYPIHPASSSRMRTAFTPSGAKDDEPDALTLLSILQKHREELRALLPDDPQTEKVALLNIARRTAIDRRTLLSNALTSLLKSYYPQAIELVGKNVRSPLALDFLSRWPDLTSLKKAKPATLQNFYQAHNVRRPETIAARLQLTASATPLTTSRAQQEVSVLELQTLVAELRVLQKHIDRIEDALAEAFTSHPDAFLFRNLPGAGAALAPRLLAAFGSDRSRYPDAASLQEYSGVAPVTEKSGSRKWVHWRLGAPGFLRQSFVEWAGQTVVYSTWAHAYYQQQKARGAGHWAILRSLAFKWIRILWRCWQDRTPYNEKRYLDQLKKRSSPLTLLIEKLSIQNT